MHRDDIIYLLLLGISIPFGHVIKYLKSPLHRQAASFIAGLMIVLLTAGPAGSWHSALAILGNYLTVQLIGLRWCHIASFIYVFSYLFFFRTCTWYGFAKPPSHCNAIQLLVTLRMVGLAFEVRQSHLDSRENVEGAKSVEDLTKVNQQKIPSLFDYFSYGYCYCGLMTGPYYSYKTYLDMLYQDTGPIATVVPALKALKYLPLFSVPYLFFQANFPLKHLATKDFLEHSWGIPYKMCYLAMCFTWFRFRFYIGWMLAKAMCITMALGAYPTESEPKPGVGPTKPVPERVGTESSLDEKDSSFSFETIHNIDVFDVEFTCSVKDAMKSWNKTVQWWLYKYVHQQIPFKSFRLTIVLFVSAFWHGVHPGYYLTFMCVPLLVLADTRMKNSIKPHLNAKQCYIYDWFNWFFIYRYYEYLGVGFMMLELGKIWDVYKSMYFIGHIFLIVLVVIPFFIPKKRKAEHKDNNIVVNHTKMD